MEAEILKYGLEGIVILALGTAVAKLYSDNQKLQKEKEAILEARRQDAVDTKDKVAGPLKELADNTKLIYDKLIVGRG